jgi:hypothetical protein
VTVKPIGSRRAGHGRADATPVPPARTLPIMLLSVLGFFLVVWIVLVILGFVIHGLFWLAIIGIVLFLVTGAFGGTRLRR